MGAAMSGKTVCSVMEAGSFVIIFAIDSTWRRIAELFGDSYIVEFRKYFHHRDTEEAQRGAEESFTTETQRRRRGSQRGFSVSLCVHSVPLR
jgi:hypothetical protein